ncbi:MAG: CHAT domain-containing protein [Chloroflexi bacterium]|nr:CHAT domain-containing protein [Chloroflexota bacterium]
MEYLSFDLRLSDWDASAYTGVAEVLSSPVGEGERYRFNLPPDILAAAGQAPRSRQIAAQLGNALFKSVLSREAQTLWYESYQVARERSRGLRLRLHVDSWELTRLSWELLYDSRKSNFLVFDPIISLVRYLRLHAAPPTLRQRGSLSILVMAANPLDQAQLNWQHEIDVLQEALAELTQAGQVRIDVLPQANYEKMLNALQTQTPDVVHYVGHGHYNRELQQGALVLEDEHGRTSLLKAHEMSHMFCRFGVNLVVLNACDTANGAWAGLAPSLVRAEIPAVVAMQWPVEDQAATRFSRFFYKALAMGRTIDECMAEGRLGAGAAGAEPSDWLAPVLFLRSQSGRLWNDDPTRIVVKRDASEGGQLALGIPTAEKAEPFTTRGPLTSTFGASLLIDRPELRRVVRLALQPSVTEYIAILSARQTGKTTLLLNLMERLQPRYRPVFIDLSVLRAQDTKACYRYLAFRLTSEFRAHMQEENSAPTTNLESTADFVEFLTQLASKVPDQRIVVLLDEVGALSPEVSDNFFSALRSVFTQGRSTTPLLSKYLFIFSGAVDLYALTFGHQSPLNICEKVYLHDFDRDSVNRLIDQFRRYNVTVAPEAREAIYTLAHGHPYLTMQLCAHLLDSGAPEIGVEQVEAAAQQMLLEDDNIHHVLHEIARRPLQRRRLRSITMEGRRMPFTRNDPVLASLEMIGAVAPTQPCSLRNPLYERALRTYFTQEAEDETETSSAAESLTVPADIKHEMYGRLRNLRAQALGSRGYYRADTAWEAFSAAFFATVPALTIVPEVAVDTERLDLALTVEPAGPEDAFWAAYTPAILVSRQSAPAISERWPVEVVREAQVRGIKLAFVILSEPAEKHKATFPATTYEGVTVVPLADSKLATLLEQEGDIDAFLRDQVRAARSRGKG